LKLIGNGNLYNVSMFAIAGIPILLTGAALVGLPVLLHLIMKQEPKRLPFPAFRFLKQRKQINQRKIRLRHFLLLLMRMALIALICLSLFQPTILSEGLSLRGDRPVAAIFVVDTSPSMGYVLSDRSGLSKARQNGLKLLEETAQGPWTCLDESRARLLEILDELPASSKVAIIDTSDRGEPVWAASLGEARKRVRDLKKTRANAQPLTRTLESAYSLLAKVDNEMELGAEPLPRLLMAFSDRTAPSWDAARVAELTSLRDRVPPPSVYHLYVDVGVDKPVNTSISAYELKPQLIAANQPLVINVAVDAIGGKADNLLVFTLDGEEVERIAISPSPDKPATRQLRKDGLKPGLHQARIALQTTDALPFDNERTITFRVREPRRVLAIIDPPPSMLLGGGLTGWLAPRQVAFTWKTAVESRGWYLCDVKTTDDVQLNRIDWTQYELVTLLGLKAPGDLLWARIEEYTRGGGQTIVVPADKGMSVANYQSDAAGKVLPRKFTNWVDVPVARDGVTWTWNALNPQRPLLLPFRKYKETNSFFDDMPPTTRGYWKVEEGSRDRMIVAYNDAGEADQRSPAVLDWPLGPRGKVLQFTVPMGFDSEKTHNYATSWFYMFLVSETHQSMTGESEDQIFNFTGGQNVVVKWPLAQSEKSAKNFIFSGPDVSPGDAVIKREPNQPYFRLGPEKTGSVGYYQLEAEDDSWKDGFSINVAAEESNLERIGIESLEDLFGKDRIAAADKELQFKDILSGKSTQPIELFPFLMIVLLLVMAFENLLANRFYRRKAGA
jgi:Aerotolerance regulator N-terminal